METFRQKQLNHELKNLGFGGLEDPQLIHQMAFCVRDHEHFRKCLLAAEPAERKVMYDTMRPHLNFEAWPLDRYIIAGQVEAEELQLPVKLKDGSMVAYKDYHGETDKPSIEVLAQNAILEANRLAAAKGSLTLTCAKCTRVAKFPAIDQLAAIAQAKKKGWVFAQRDEVEYAICPKCPSVQPRRDLAHA